MDKAPVRAQRFMAVTANPHATDAAHAILSKPSREFTGNFCIDDLVLHAAGVRDFSVYAAVPGATQFLPDFFVPENTPALPA